MRFFFDECLDPALVKVATEGNYEATCSRDRGMLGWSDVQLASYVVDHDWVLVTNNSKDFRGRLAGPGGKPGFLTSNMHPGLICLNRRGLENKGIVPALQEELFRQALDEIASKNIVDLMNQILEIDYDEAIETVTSNLWEAPAE